MSSFPSDFIWGAATAAYQIEGAHDVDDRGPSIWDTFSRIPGKVVNGDTGDIACDFYNRYPEDIRMMQELGIKHFRMSIAWARLFPNGDAVRNPKGFDFYDRVIDALLSAGIEPNVTLYHWDLPQSLGDLGGWADRSVLEPFAEYAGAVGSHFGDRVKRFAPINEPWCVSWLGHGLGLHAPGETDFSRAIAAAHHTVVGHNLATKALHDTVTNALVGPVLNQTMPDVDDITDPFQMRAASVLDMNQNTFWMNAILKGEYPELAYEIYGDDLRSVVHEGDLEVQPIEWLGVNFYSNARIGHRVDGPAQMKQSIVSKLIGATMESKPMGPLTDMGWPITPQGIGDLLVRWTREYPDQLPRLFISENGVAFDDGPDESGRVADQRRIDYLNAHIGSVQRAIERGADVGGYYVWSLLDNFEWALGYEKRFGIVHVDYQTQVRTPKDSARWYSQVLQFNSLPGVSA